LGCCGSTPRRSPTPGGSGRTSSVSCASTPRPRRPSSPRRRGPLIAEERHPDRHIHARAGGSREAAGRLARRPPQRGGEPLHRRAGRGGRCGPGPHSRHPAGRGLARAADWHPQRNADRAYRRPPGGFYEGHDVMAGAMPLIRGRVPGAKRIVLGDGTLRRDIGVSPPWLRPAPGLLGPGALASRTSWCQLDPGRPHRRARRRAAPGPLVLHVRDRLPRGSHARAPGGAGRPPRRDHRKLVSRRATVSNIGSVHWILHIAPMSSAWLVVTIEVVRRPPAKEAGGLDPCRHVPRT
jgi:hypothetical protein